MASNKDAQTRYLALDKCFSNQFKKYFIEDLIEACNVALLNRNPDSKGVQRRQVFEDIKYMEETWNLALDKVKVGRRIHYRYNDPKFSIEKQPLNQSEIEQLKSAMELLARFEGMPQFGWVNELMPKLQQSFLLERNHKPIISFDNNQYLTGIERLGMLFQSILYKQVLCIQYQPFHNEEASELIIHPYYLKQYNNRWFLFGLNSKYEKIFNLALDRIIAVREENILFIENTLCDFNEYFDDIVGVTRLEKSDVIEILLSFDLKTAPYILSKPLHGSQKVKSRTDQELVISIEVSPNYELESALLAFGEKVKVLEPESFRKLIAGRLKAAVSMY
ncbi:WYL domain-containing protein [Dyadobacter sp. LJ53]|uniref:helix-turn-helix transcriptional regulator n=1 Tax=Dyadobacter chenwenxiniae TaxID=2906456 RepID=UPI001F16C15E|nr:WYL domain-containing protein [Dyadobacter chenwenxiniae]MCF0051636.1 WYL domain-containing protein [Dyadobacter chenwenxiniae]